MITQEQAVERIASLRAQVENVETNILPQIMKLSEQMMEAVDEETFIALQEAQNALLAEAGESACVISGRIAELISLFEIEEEAT